MQWPPWKTPAPTEEEQEIRDRRATNAMDRVNVLIERIERINSEAGQYAGSGHADG